MGIQVSWNEGSRLFPRKIITKQWKYIEDFFSNLPLQSLEQMGEYHPNLAQSTLGYFLGCGTWASCLLLILNNTVRIRMVSYYFMYYNLNTVFTIRTMFFCSVDWSTDFILQGWMTQRVVIQLTVLLFTEQTSKFKACIHFEPCMCHGSSLFQLVV